MLHRDRIVAASLRPGALVVLGLALGCCLATLAQGLPKAPSVLGLADAPTDTNQVAAADSNAVVRPLAARLGEARDQLAALGEMAPTNAPAGVTGQQVWMRRAMLDRLVRLYEQQSSSLAELETARARKADITRESQTWTRFSEPQPYSILLTDRLREELHAEQLKMAKSEVGGEVLDGLIQENRKSLAQAEERIRQLNEQLEDTADPAASARLTWQREQERLRSQVSAATVAVLDLERQVGQETMASSRVKIALLQRQLATAQPGARFTQTDLDQATARVERERAQLELELAGTQVRREAAYLALEAAREELRRTREGTATPAAVARVQERVDTREAQLEAADTVTRVLRLMLEGRNVERAMWEQRFAAHDSGQVATLRESRRRLDSFLRRLDLWREHEQQQMDVASSQIQLQRDRLQSLPTESDLLPLVRERLAALSETDQTLLRSLRSVERLQQLAQRWHDSLRDAAVKLPFTSRLQDLFSDARTFVGKLWDFELFSAEDTILVDGQKFTGRRSVTIGKVATALFILVSGVWLIGVATRFFEPVIVKRFEMEPAQAGLIRRWLRAFLIVCLVLLSLAWVKIPLTVFAFAGGALAIGLGFGMQTILKNLVSGMILLFERPFRVGDVLDVGGQKGTVTSIGLRASVLQLWDGTETLIPNSSLLENNVTNWTYSSNKVRFTVTVGAAYGSDPRRVIQVLGEVADRHGLVEKEPRPLVLFTEFADSTLTFELRFWLDVSKANSAQVASDLRFMIASAFAEHGIAIDYPQRDVHLHAAQPLPVQVVPVAIATPEPPAAPAKPADTPEPKPNTESSEGTIPPPRLP